ncbi:MAG: dihydrolipoyl dehydrogenase [Desulfobacterales bacterium]|jgi:dihydrolipoamide dehydrogenase|nr:dihydrolipoyl dehydrogenase [Desulfobacterales bacterium]
MAENSSYDLVIIGSGPGGYVAAVRAAQLGLKTACVEKWPRPGGVCLNVGCIPSKALLDSSEHFHFARTGLAGHGITAGEVRMDLAKMMARKEQVVKELTDNVRKLLETHKVALVPGTAKLAGRQRVEVASAEGSRTLTAPNIILATGSEPLAPAGLAFDGKTILSSTEALRLDAVPERLGIVGGGYIGLELGSVWLRLGAQVTVIEMLPEIAPTLDGQVRRRLQSILKRQGFTFRLGTRVKRATAANGRAAVEVESDTATETLEFDALLVSVGRRPLTRGLGLEAAGVETDPQTGCVRVDASLRTSAPGIYAIGDLVPGPMLAHKASAEGRAAAEIIAGQPGEVNYDAIPAIVYTAPEVAGVGLTEEQVKERRIPYATGVYPFAGVGRARCLGETEGFVKLIAHKTTDRLLGAHIIGARAAEMIAEAVIALEFGASAEDIARTVHAHPTFSEAVMEAAAAVRA